MSTFKRNLQKLVNQRGEKSLEQIKDSLLLQAEAQIKDNFNRVQDWDNNFGTTKRRNGEVVRGNVRNTVDTGALRDSLRLYWDGDSLQATLDTRYDKYVIYGYVTRSGKVIEGRPVLDLTD